MLLKKLSKNNKEIATSPIIFVGIVLTLMVLCCGFLDLMNVARLKSVVVEQCNYLSFAAINQGGFKNALPEDWQQFYKTNASKTYVTASQAKNWFREAISHTIGDENSVKIVLKTDSNGNQVVGGGRDCILNRKEEGTLTCSVEYELHYLTTFGFFNEKFICKSSNPVVGFWIHKSDEI